MKEELEPIELIRKSMSYVNQQKGELAEFASQLWLNLFLKVETKVLDMRYDPEFTKLLNQLKEGFLGRGASEDRYFIKYRNAELFKLFKRKKEGEISDGEYFKEWLKLSNLKSLMEKLGDLTQDEKALRIIGEIQCRFCGLDDDYGMPRFLKLLGLLRGTKFDWLVGIDGRPYLFDSKYWIDSNKNLVLDGDTIETYKEFRKVGLPFYLLIYCIDKEFLFQLDIDLISLEGYEGHIDKDLIKKQPRARIPKRLIESIKRIIQTEEPSQA